MFQPRQTCVEAYSKILPTMVRLDRYLNFSGMIIKDLPIGSVAPIALSTDRTTVEAPLASADLENLSASSQIIDRLESASGKLQALTAGKIVVETHLVLKDLVEEKLPPSLIDATTSIITPETTNEKRLRSPSMKGVASGLAKKGKN